MFKDRFIYSAKIIAVFTVCLTFCFLFAMPTYATNDTASEDDPVKLTADFIKEAEITVENDTVVLCKTTNISGNAYRVETVCLVPEDDKTADYVLKEIQDFTQQTRSSQTATKFDGSYSVEGWVCITYTEGTSSYGPWVNVTNISGGYTRYDHSVGVKSQELHCGCSGENPNTGAYSTQYVTYYPSSSSWSYPKPASWGPVVYNSNSKIAATCTYTLKRGSNNNTWTFKVDCVVANQFDK